jgi:hypothetical protein
MIYFKKRNDVSIKAPFRIFLRLSERFSDDSKEVMAQFEWVLYNKTDDFSNTTSKITPTRTRILNEYYFKHHSH